MFRSQEQGLFLFIEAFTLFAGLALLNIAFYLRRIFKLQQKEFHLLMLTLNLLCSVFMILCNLFQYLEFTTNRPLRAYRLTKCSIYLFISTVAQSHLIFVIKLWVLAIKVRCIASQREDPSLNKKGQITFYVLTLLVWFACVAEVLVAWNDISDDASLKLTLPVTITMFVPQVITLALLFHAYHILKQH
jgi:hypothetical protein